MIRILDTTLREGEQTPGVCFPPYLKAAIAHQLDAIGVSYIEAGHPAVDDEIREAVQHLAAQPFSASIAAHARSLQRDVDAALECGVDFLGIFYCVSKDRLTGVFRKEFAEAVAGIEHAIAYAKDRRPDLTIRYTPEDTVRSDFNHVVDAAASAVNAGADIISVADTTGYMIPDVPGRDMYAYVMRLREALDQRGHAPDIAVHCHNDRGVAIANALGGYRAGARIIDASVLGLGERAGIVDLATLMTVLRADFNVGEHWDLTHLPELYRLVSNRCGAPVPANSPIVGDNAFTHCAGVHTNAALKNPAHYESLTPDLVGRSRDIAIDHMSGRSTIEWALDRLEIDADDDLIDAVLTLARNEGRKGRCVGLDELAHMVDYIRAGHVHCHMDS